MMKGTKGVITFIKNLLIVSLNVLHFLGAERAIFQRCTPFGCQLEYRQA